MAEHTVLGMPIDTEAPGLAQPLAAIVVVKGLNEAGEVAYWALATEGVQSVEALGMARYAALRLENGIGGGLMRETSNTYLTVMRGTELNKFGDETDVGVPLYRHIPATLVETSHQTFDRAEGTHRTIRTIMCAVPAWADIDTDDTLQDELTGQFYMIEDITRQPTLGLPADTMLTLQARSGISISTD